MRLASRGRVLSVFLAAVLFLIAICVPAGTAVANGSQFSLSTTSLRAGQTVIVTEADPCPEPNPNSWGQYVYVSFTDSNNSSVLYSAETSTLGHWNPIWLNTPAQRAYSLPPPEASLGQGTVAAWCVEMGEEGDVTTMSYSSQTLTITGSSAKFAISPASPKHGQTVSIQSTDPCPSGTASVEGYLDDMDTGIADFAVTPDGSGHWEAVVTIPSWLQVGEARVIAKCHPPMPHWGTLTQKYGEVETSLLPATPYVALGDSYSAGTGTFDYYPGSDDCYRSGLSYPLYVANQLDLGVPLFAACHGAQTADFYNGNQSTGEPAQISHLSVDTEVVTLTIGGNDAGFKDVMEKCVKSPKNPDGWGCSTDTSLSTNLTQRFGALAGTTTTQAPDGRTITSLAQLYEDVATAAPNAKIYVGGYPRLFGSSVAHYEPNSSAPGSAYCAVTIGASVSYSDAQWLNQKANELNGIIADAVTAAQNDGVDVTFVPAALFSGSGLCDMYSPWINDVVLTSPPALGFLPESLHPTSDGYQNGYGIAFVSVMN